MLIQTKNLEPTKKRQNERLQLEFIFVRPEQHGEKLSLMGRTELYLPVPWEASKRRQSLRFFLSFFLPGEAFWAVGSRDAYSVERGIAP